MPSNHTRASPQFLMSARLHHWLHVLRKSRPRGSPRTSPRARTSYIRWRMRGPLLHLTQFTEPYCRSTRGTRSPYGCMFVKIRSNFDKSSVKCSVRLVEEAWRGKAHTQHVAGCSGNAREWPTMAVAGRRVLGPGPLSLLAHGLEQTTQHLRLLHDGLPVPAKVRTASGPTARQALTR